MKMASFILFNLGYESFITNVYSWYQVDVSHIFQEFLYVSFSLLFIKHLSWIAMAYCTSGVWERNETPHFL